MNTRWTGTIRNKRLAVANRTRTTTITAALFSFLFVITAGNPIQAAGLVRLASARREFLNLA